MRAAHFLATNKIREMDFPTIIQGDFLSLSKDIIHSYNLFYFCFSLLIQMYEWKYVVARACFGVSGDEKILRPNSEYYCLKSIKT